MIAEWFKSLFSDRGGHLFYFLELPCNKSYDFALHTSNYKITFVTINDISGILTRDLNGNYHYIQR